MKKQNIKIFITLSVTITITATTTIFTNSTIKKKLINQPKAESSRTTNFYGTPINLIKVFGQQNFKETSEDTVVANKIFHAAGVLVDKSSKPNKIYVADTGNNRILGFDGVGNCRVDTNQKCTNDTDCPGDLCVVNTKKDADLIFGQTSTDTATCNGDNNLGVFTNPTASTLCLMSFPVLGNIGESRFRIHFEADSQGNLYIPDISNNRVLKFNQPFSADKSGGKGDVIADFVIGQADFNSRQINHGLGAYARDNSSLFLDLANTRLYSNGVSVDNSGNVWVGDASNGRVLRFPPSSKQADLVIGQTDFISRDNSVCSLGPRNNVLDKVCGPTVARVNPQTGELYVQDEYFSGGESRILIYSPPFYNGMSAKKIIHIPTEPNINGFVFNEFRVGDYASGVIWVTEEAKKRALLLDDDGRVVKIIGSPNLSTQGCNFTYYNRCKGHDSIFRNFNLCAPGGQIGFDDTNNIYLADEDFHRISRFSLPYQLTPKGDDLCPPDANGGLMDGNSPNSITGYKWRAGNLGAISFGNQLIVRDHNRYLVWENYLGTPMGAKSDFVIGQPSENVRNGNFITSRGFHAIDDKNRMWTLSDSWKKIMIYQLPLTPGGQPLATNVRLYWTDTGEEIDYDGVGAVAFDKINKKIWVIDHSRARLLRVSNYDNFSSKLYVDMVLGQLNKTTIGCNHGLGVDHPGADSLCVPYALEFDNFGNLFVVENNYEGHGNMRIVMYAAEDLHSAQELFPRLQAKKVFLRKSFTERSSHDYRNFLDEPCSPISIAFNSKNQMVIGNDGYYGDLQNRHLRQLWFYDNPLKKDDNNNYIQGQKPDSYINLPMGAAAEITFDKQDNLFIQDHVFGRVWLINLDLDPSWLVYPQGYLTPTPSPPCVESTVGDADGNNITSLLDFEIIRKNLGRRGNLQGDVNCDQNVNPVDLQIWENAFLY